MKVSVVEAEPFGSVDSGVEGEEEWVVELLVSYLGGEHGRRGSVEVRGKDAQSLLLAGRWMIKMVSGVGKDAGY